MTIFFSYRRSDTKQEADRLYTALKGKINPALLFMDVANIEGGENFEEKIKEVLKECAYVFVLMGPEWLDTLKKRMKAKETDYVRYEVRSALELKRRVIPILVGNMNMPKEADLPADLKPLAKQNAMLLRADHFDEDLRKILDVVGFVIQLSKVNRILALLVFSSIISGVAGLLFPPLEIITSLLGLELFIVGPIYFVMVANLQLKLSGKQRI